MGQLLQLEARRGMGQVQDRPYITPEDVFRRGPMPVPLPIPDWRMTELMAPLKAAPPPEADFLEQETIPGIKNLHVLYAGAGLLTFLTFASAIRRR